MIVNIAAWPELPENADMGKRKRIAGLDGSAPADKMIRLILSAQVKAMCAQRAKALKDDPEGVHDMRVSSRRLRSAISDFKTYFRKFTLPRRKLKAIARSLGAVRDEDVALAALEKLASKAPGRAAEGVGMLVEEGRRRRSEARAALKETISATAVAEFRRKFLASVRSAKVLSHHQSSDSEVALIDVAVEIIGERLREFRASGPHIYDPFEKADLHELRILAKRLRYAIELFAVCWGDKMANIANEIAHLQTSLGELHDRDVWMDRLDVRKDREDDEDVRLREGVTWLIKQFTKERKQHYRDALARWKRWKASGFLEGLESILERKVP